jgi:3',5'-cyclic-AMP phosphodiesterase
MPITLPPISRRRMLASSLAAAAGLALRPWESFGAAEDADPDRLILLSDIHIDADRAFTNKDGVIPWKNLAANTVGGRPAPVLITGDCARLNGVSGDYTTLIEAVKPLRDAGLPVHMILGNHDDRANFWKALPADEARTPGLNDHHVLALSTPRANLILLDSLEITNKTPGVLGADQLAWLARTLDADTTKPAMVFVHHHPIVVVPTKFPGLTDHKALLDCILPRKHVKALFFGHTHDWTHATRDGLHMVNLPPTAWIFEKARPQGWVDARLRNNGVTLALHTLDPKHPDHGQVLDLAWR